MLRTALSVAVVWVVLAMDVVLQDLNKPCRFLCPNRFGLFVMCCDPMPIRENVKLKCPPRPRYEYLNCTGINVYVRQCRDHSECEPEGKQCCRDVCYPVTHICMPGTNNFHYLTPYYPPEGK